MRNLSIPKFIKPDELTSLLTGLGVKSGENCVTLFTKNGSEIVIRGTIERIETDKVVLSNEDGLLQEHKWTVKDAVNAVRKLFPGEPIDDLITVSSKDNSDTVVFNSTGTTICTPNIKNKYTARGIFSLISDIIDGIKYPYW